MLLPMLTFDRRASDRRGISPSTTISLGAVLADERREASDRRRSLRRRNDVRTIAHFARRIDAGQTRLEVIVDSVEGLRLVAMFTCGCSAIEPVGAGEAPLRTVPCAQHAAPRIEHDRRRRRSPRD